MDTRQVKLQTLLRILGTLVAFGLVIYLLSQQGWDKIWEGIRQIPAGYFVASIFLMMLSRTAVAMRWYTLLHSAGVKVSLWQCWKITFAGLFASNFLPTTIGGDVVRLAMAVQAGFDKVITTASLVVDRLVGMAGMGSAAPFGFFPIYRAVYPVSEANPAPAFGLLTIVASMPRGQALMAAGRRAMNKLWQAVTLWMRSPRGLLLAFIYTWGHQFCIFAVNWLLFRGLGEPIPFWLAGGLWSFTYFVTLLPISINGLGIQELSMTFIFSHFGGVSASGAAIVALLVRTIQSLASVPGAFSLPEILSGMKNEV